MSKVVNAWKWVLLGTMCLLAFLGGVRAGYDVERADWRGECQAMGGLFVEDHAPKCILPQ